MKNSGYEKVFQDASVWRSIFRMAVPSLLTIVVMIFYNMADTFFIAQLGDYTKVASVSIVTPVFSMIMALSTMIGAGGSAVIAGDIGADNREKAMNDSSTCFYAAVILGIVLSACLLMFPDPLLRMLGTKPEMWNDSAAYLRILSCGTVFMLIPSAMGMIVRAEGAVKEGLIGNMSGTVTNLILDPLFILVFRWGVPGAAIATVIGNIISSCYYIFYVLKRSRMLSLSLRRALISPAAILPVAALGVPNALSTILSGFSSAFSNSLLSGYGTQAIAARAAAGKASMLISMVQMGICMGVQPLLAYHYGAGDQKRLREVLQKTALLTGIIGAGTMLICFVFRHFIVSLFLKDMTVAAISEKYMLYVMAGAPFLGIVYLTTSFLQASKNAGSAVLVSLLRQGLLLIPLLYLFHRIFGFYGIAASHTAADILAALLAGAIFFREYRKFAK